MRIVVIGANGQVGTEVSLLLAGQPGVEVRPVARSHSGSAYLRYRGLPVMHGSIADPAAARRLLEGADVVANLALALGTPAASMEENERIIAQTFEAAPAGATVVFFSTLAVLGVDDPERGRKRSMYAKLKLANERQVQAMAARTGQRGYVLRLGHVAGPLQNITQAWRREIEAGPVVMVDPERHANVIFTVTIADALTAIGDKRAGPPGLYDLVNVPQWTWRQVYALEAERAGLPLSIEIAAPSAATRQRRGAARSVRAAAVSMINRFGLKERATRLAAELPQSLNESMKAEHYVTRARAEIAQLRRAKPAPAAAQLWPGITASALPGLRPTRELVEQWHRIEAPTPPERRWPADL